MATSRDLKVGAFALAGLLAIGIVIFFIGEEKKLFEKKVEYKTVFDDVQGLRRGSPVRMGGVDVGSVTQVGYGPNVQDSKIHVRLSVVLGEGRRIREDSVVTIEGKGLLGDKMLVISVGSPHKPPIPEGGTIPSRPAEDMTQMISKMASITGQVEKVVDNLEQTSRSFADQAFHKDLKSTASSLSGILESVDRGEGYVGRMVKSPEEAERLSRVVSNLESVTRKLDQTADNVNAILGRVKTGPGFAHEVLYGEEGSKAISQFGGAADELRLTLKGIRDGNGLARSVIYGDSESQQMMSNLNQMSGDLRQIVADVRAGKGTVGALLVDPSIYEDLKMVLGNVERNKALRALVRYSIKKDGAAPNPEVRDSEPGAVGKAGLSGAAEAGVDGAR
jgi:phospholipid/cholesterol/gamma-HCH transport system substrate-binding protein